MLSPLFIGSARLLEREVSQALKITLVGVIVYQVIPK
jgi:hypothetical protein